MPVTYRYLIHANGPALWPEHKSAEECLALKHSTLPMAWEGTYQSNPTPPGGVVFLRDWWNTPDLRYDAMSAGVEASAIARYLSFDTAMTDKSEARASGDPDFTACVVGDLLPDSRLLIRRVWRERVGFPELHAAITRLTDQYNQDGKLRAVVIEDRGSGTSALQTLRQGSDQHLAEMLVPFMPTTGKQVRAQQAALWCANGCVLLPAPGMRAPAWMLDFEDELFTFPGGVHDDQVDAMVQLVIYLEHYLSTGFHTRQRPVDAVLDEPFGGDDRVSNALREAQAAKEASGSTLVAQRRRR